MVSSPVFLKIRAIAFSLIVSTSLLWIVLLCLYINMQWADADPSEHPLIAIMLLMHTLTLVILLLLLILPFRHWLDCARIGFLILIHISVAAAFVYWNPTYQCPTTSPDAEGVCRLLNLYILIASWVNPVLLIIYAAGLALAIVRSSGENKLPLLTERESILPIMRPALDYNPRLLSYPYPAQKPGTVLVKVPPACYI
ncbi:hypothetical protein C8J57DRAFT_1286367 [Mycena rebaudengoi]|nr:hypothetical protein C8J57DRAFT_1286367 [Mycena rebaudengoi]